MGRVLCEANAAGIPVIASKSGGIPSVITDDLNGLLFTGDDESLLLEKISDILENDSLQQLLIENGVHIAQEKFDWHHIVRDHEKAFEISSK